ncbi:MAG: class I SAM-dependent methyltransferase [Bacteroidota bacterium]
MKLLTPQDWQAYELIDTGEGEKLERFGKYVLRRPEPQAVWSKAMPEDTWQQMTQARFVQAGSHSGEWQTKKVPDQWYVNYKHKEMQLRFRLGLTAFKHVGLFPEQAANWQYIYEHSKRIPGAKVLNLFAYTGGASLAARAAGADVTHCDSIKNVLNWANVNMQHSKLTDIRWLLEDAFKFVKRESKRKRRYQGIILDPPAYGHGPKGEKWKLEDMIDELTQYLSHILDPEHFFLVFNSYSLGFSPLILQNLVRTHFKSYPLDNLESVELYMPDRTGRKLPLGIVARLWN